MIRWKYLIPRVAILLLIVCAVWLSKDPLLKWCIVQSGQSATGAKVEIGKVESSILSGEVNLIDIEIADPRSPMKNMIQADVAKLKLDPRRLFHRQFVIDEGRMSGVQFGTPRTESGALPNRDRNRSGSGLSDQVRSQLVQLGQSWLDQFQFRMRDQVDENFETVQVAKDLRERWPKEFERQRNRALALKAKVKSLKATIETPPRNPLRLDAIPKAIADLEQVRKDIIQAHNDLQRLSNQATIDRDALIAARDRDEAKIKQTIQISKVDGASATELLLGEKQAAYINETIGWINWLRATVPNPETDFFPERQVGTRIQFSGVKKRPGLLVRKLQLDGTGTFGGKHYHFAGFARDLTSSPKNHDLPTTFELSAQGEQQVHIHATVDRRNEKTIDELTILCPNIQLAHQSLGDEQAMVLSMGPSRLNADIRIRLEGDQLTGKLLLQQSNVDLNVDQLHRLAGGPAVAQAINRELAGLSRFDVTIDLSGTLARPRAKLQSDLGDKIALAMNTAFEKTAQQVVARHSLKLQQIIDSELADLRREFNANTQEILGILQKEVSQVSDIQSILPSLNAWPKIR